MNKTDYRLKGHESFIPRDGWITKGLAAVYNDKNVFSSANSYGADSLGVGTNMAKSIRYWLKAMGLTKDTAKGVCLSSFGEMIYKYDAYIEDIFTLWLLHINLVCNFQQATTWNVFFNDFSISSFTREEMINFMKEQLVIRTGDNKLSERSVRDDCSAILQMYSEVVEKTNDPEDKKVSPFASLELLKVDNSVYVKKRPALNAIRAELIFYIINNELQESGSILIDDMIEKDNMPGKLLNLNRVLLNDYLDQLQSKGLVIINRTAGLDVVYPNKKMDTLMILEEYYGGE